MLQPPTLRRSILQVFRRSWYAGRGRCWPTSAKPKASRRISSTRLSNQVSRRSTLRFASSIRPLSTSRTRALPKPSSRPRTLPGRRLKLQDSYATLSARVSIAPTPILRLRWLQRDGGDVSRDLAGSDPGLRSMAEPPYRRVIIKVAGEALVGPGGFGIHQPTLDRIATDVVAARGSGVAIGIVIGGGNIFRGVSVSKNGIPRATGDMMGMLATVMNGLALESALQKAGASARVMSALAMPGFCESYERGRALRLLAGDHVLVFSGGIGNPFLRRTRQPFCGPPKSEPMRCSRPRMSMASTVRI